MKIEKQKYGDVDFYHYKIKGIHDGLQIVDNTRTIINGFFKVTLMLNSYKWGDQLQFRILTPLQNGFKVENRAKKSNWNTTEINIPYSEIDNLIQALQDFKKRKP